MKTAICYSRSKHTRGYQVVSLETGRVLAQFGSGPQEKAKAERAQLERECPKALALADRIARKYPELKARALRGAQLYALGHVRRNGAEGRYDVRSQSKPGVTYQVNVQLGSCTCPDWENSLLGMDRAAPWCGNGPKCKHLLACYMAQMLDS